MLFEWNQVNQKTPEDDKYILLKVKAKPGINFKVVPYSVGHYENGKYYAVGGLANRIVVCWAYIPE